MFGAVLSFFIVFLLFRLAFVWVFISGMAGTPSELIRAFWIGMRFDLRLACFILLPLGLALMVPIFNPMTHSLSCICRGNRFGIGVISTFTFVHLNNDLELI